MLEQSILIILKPLLNTQMIWLIKTLKNTIEIKQKILIVFDNMIADMLNNEKPNLIVTEYFIRGRKLNISLGFITQSYFAEPKDIRGNSTHYFIIKIPKQKRTSTNCISSFIRYLLSRLYESL